MNYINAKIECGDIKYNFCLNGQVKTEKIKNIRI